MSDFLFSLVTMLHVAFRGHSTTFSSQTNNMIKQTHSIAFEDGVRRFIVTCRQFKHSVVFKHRFIPNRTYFTYMVEFLLADGEDNSKNSVGFYPHLCSYYLHETTFPLHCAVRAHLDNMKRARSV